MEKLVVLNLEGDWETQGFRVILSIGSEGDYPKIQDTGKLPPAPDLLACLKKWQQKYRTLEKCYRIRPVAIYYQNISLEQRLSECNQSASELKHRLQNWLKSEDFQRIDKRLRKELDRWENIRVLICTRNRQLQKLPWHLWDLLDRYDKAEVALSLPEFKRIQKSLHKTPKNKVRILAILGDSEGIDLAADRMLLENLPDAEIMFLVEPRRREINDKLWEQPWDILFFAGHSETMGEKSRIYINPEESLTTDDLCYGLKKAVEQGLQLAIFNSCQGLGLVKQLESVQIPQIIVMRELVPDRVAQEFLKYFLAAFAKGSSLYLAVRDAREQLQSWEDKYPFATWLPVIWQNQAEVPFSWEELLQKPELGQVEPPILANCRKNWQQVINGLLALERIKRKLCGNNLGWVVLLLGIVLVGNRYPTVHVAKWVNDVGKKNYLADEFPEAITKWQLARTLDPLNPLPHYNQGWHCEDVRDFDCAKKKYQMAAKLGFAAAYINLGRLYILVDKDYSGAVNLLLQGQKFVNKEPEKTQKILKYALHKNLGWARLEQGRYQEASEHLQAAIELDGDRASAYCLLAQVLERQGDREGAIAQWETCLRYATPKNPDEDRWIGMARKVFNSVEPDIDKEIATLVEISFNNNNKLEICEDRDGKILCPQ